VGEIVGGKCSGGRVSIRRLWYFSYSYENKAISIWDMYEQSHNIYKYCIQMSYTSHQSYSYSSNGGGKSKSSNHVVRIENGVVVEDSKIETQDGVRVKPEPLKENETSKVVILTS